MSEVELSAGMIEYDDTGGDGPVLVFLHGVAMDGSVWAPVVARTCGATTAASCPPFRSARTGGRCAVTQTCPCAGSAG
jgi:pimeloyl-ACP methyl ester carboxylesterase